MEEHLKKTERIQSSNDDSPLPNESLLLYLYYLNAQSDYMHACIHNTNDKFNII